MKEPIYLISFCEHGFLVVMGVVVLCYYGVKKSFIVCHVAAHLERGFSGVLKETKLLEIVSLKGTLRWWEYLLSLISYYSCIHFFVGNI
jgi:hypothetical protein